MSSKKPGAGLFQALRTRDTSLVTGRLNSWLLQQSNRPNDRAHNVNAPSAAGACNRANYYSRMGYPVDSGIDPRTQRIFDNGTHVHLRLQDYLKRMEVLLMDEVPVINFDLNIQGHTDGLISVPDSDEIAVLEIKSINDAQFSKLVGAKYEHACQGLVYLHCLETRRQELRRLYASDEEFYASLSERQSLFASRYQHLRDGSRFTREEKIQYEVDLCLLADNFLWNTSHSVCRVVFLYENKNNQELKEFVVQGDYKAADSREYLVDVVLQKYKALNAACASHTLPEREGTGKSDMTCRWCPYANECWVV